MRTIVLFTYCLLFSAVWGQINFFNLYTDNGDDFGEGIVQLEDSSYVITGSSSSFGFGPSDAFLLKIDSLGNYLWSKNYGGVEADVGRRVMYNPGDGFYVAGTTNSFGSGAYDFYLLKTDLTGNLLWEKTYGGSGWEKLNDAVLTNDGGLIMVGENSSNSTDNKDAFIVKTDLNGDTLWTKLIGGSGDDYVNSIHRYHDSLYVSVGAIYVEDSLKVKGLSVYFDQNGTNYWIDTLGNSSNNVILHDAIEKNNEILLVGEHFVTPSFRNIFYTKTDLNGFVLSSSYSTTSLSRRAHLIDTLKNTNSVYISAIYEDPAIGPGFDISMREHSTNFGNLSANLLGMTYPGDDIPGQILATNDGGSIIVGRTDSQFTNYHHIFVCKVGPNNTMPVTTVPHNQIPLVGLNDISHKDEVYIHPNPATSSFFISGDIGAISRIKISDMKGSVVLVGATKTIDTSLLKPGLYVVLINSEKGVFRKRLVIQ